jgi:hypothetical protein
MTLLAVAQSAAAVAPAQSPALARRALDARLDEPEPLQPQPRLESREIVEPDDLREQIIGLLPGETLEGVARTLADRKVQLRLSSDRALVLVRVPIG